MSKRTSQPDTTNPQTVIAPRLGLRPEEAAKAIGIGKRKLWEMTNRGEIPCLRIGRCVVYPIPVLEAWLAEQAHKKRGSQ